MPNERVIEIPWALQQLPQSGIILDVGSCEATYLKAIPNSERALHCLDSRNCPQDIPEHAIFYAENLLGNTLPAGTYDAVLVLSTLEHIGFPTYDQPFFPDGDRLALSEIRRLLKPHGFAILTFPVGMERVLSWSRQYSPAMIKRLFEGWRTSVTYWGFNGEKYVPIEEPAVYQYNYHDGQVRAGAVAGVIAYPGSVSAT